VRVQSWAISDVGRQRVANEDCHYVDTELGLLLVLDGMGGHRAGEVASKLAMETISAFYTAHAVNSRLGPEMFDDYDHRFTYHTNLLRQAVFIANRVVVEKSMSEEGLVGMGSTLTGLAVHEFTASLINVGDSRTYLIRNGTIEQISKDHTLAEDQVERGMMSREEARDSQLKHILSSVIGVDSRIRVHMDELVLSPGDMFLLCSDGLTAVMNDEETLAYIMSEPPGPDVLGRLIEEVNERGGPDNTTLVLTILENDQAPTEKISESE
jgi:PPM family protein phosphatase